MATRRLRPEDWAPMPRTRIQIRAVPPRDIADERRSASKGIQRATRPAPINYMPGEAPIIGRMSEEMDSPGAPEIVEFAAPGTWPRRGPSPHIAFQQQAWGAKRAGSPGTVSQYSSRQSEMSFGILDYYTRDPSPTRSPTLPSTPKLPSFGQGPPKIGTPVIDPAMEKFDFGLPLRSSRPTSQSRDKQSPVRLVSIVDDAIAGAPHHQCRSSVDRTPPIPPPKPEKIEPSKTMYSLFPKDTTPPARPSQTARSDSRASLEFSVVAGNISSMPSHQHPDPSYRPRKESVTSSLRSRKDSFTGYRANTQRIPLRVFSASSTADSSVYTTPRTSNTNPGDINMTSRRISSSATSPPDRATTSKAGSHSRWSEDTISSPVAALQGRRASFESLLRGVEDERRSGQYPACFFEDDDDEVVPLRRKLHWGRGISLQSQQHARKSGSVSSVEEENREFDARKSGKWRKWMLCGCGA